MDYSYEEVMKYIEEEDVKFIRLAFRDAFGVQKNISVTPVEMKKALGEGVPIKVDPIYGFRYGKMSTLYLRPQSGTMSILPWRPDNGRVLRMFCNVYTEGGDICNADTRIILRKAVEKAAEKGIEFRFGTKSEFYLFLKDEEGNVTETPYDQAGYMDIAPLDKCENVRRDICLTIEKMGLIPERSYHKSGPGQNEVDFHYAKPMKAADQLTTFKMVVSTVANKYGLAADFSPIPLKGKPGNGYHIDVYASDAEGNDVAGYAAAGILEKLRDMTIFLNPMDDSYTRLENILSTHYAFWSKIDQKAPMVLDTSGKMTCSRLRSPDAWSNPYLVYALLIHAGLSGIDRKLDSAEWSLDQPDYHKRLNLKTYKSLLIPSSRREAATIASESDFIREIVPEEIIKEYMYNYEQK